MKLEVHSLSTRNFKSFLVPGLLPQAESLSVSNLFSGPDDVFHFIRSESGLKQTAFSLIGSWLSSIKVGNVFVYRHS